MYIKDFNKINSLACKLDKNNISPLEAEEILHQILSDLLLVDGYKISKTNTKSSHHLDFIGLNDTNNKKIGIEYKHYKDEITIPTVRKFISSVIFDDFEKALLVTNSKFTKNAIEFAQRSYPFKIELIDINGLRSWISRIERTNDYDLDTVNIIRKNFSDQIINEIVKNPRYLDDIEWRELEYLVQSTFEAIGFSSQITPPSKDGGKDIVLKCHINNSEHTYYVELKHWRSYQKVGKKDVSDFIQVVVNEKLNGGLFLSTYGYCNNAFSMLSKVDREIVKFGDKEKIITLCQQYVKSKSELWIPTTNLAEILFEKTV